MDSREAAEQFVDCFHRVYLEYYVRRPPRARGVSREALATLEHLAQTGPLTVTEAAKHFNRSQSAMSELLDRLEHRGLVERVQDQRDRRRRLVWLTEEGLTIWRDAPNVLSVERLEMSFAELEPDRRQVVLEAMNEILGRCETRERDENRQP